MGMFTESCYVGNPIPSFVWELLSESQKQELASIFYDNLKKAICDANYKGAVEAMVDTSVRRMTDNMQFRDNSDIEKIVYGAVKAELVKMKMTYI